MSHKCALCGKGLSLLKSNSYMCKPSNERVEIWYCDACNHGTTTPFLTDKECIELYDSNYSQNPFYKSEAEESIPIFYRLLKKFDYLLSRFFYILPKRIQEVLIKEGCASILRLDGVFLPKSKADKFLDYGAGNFSLVRQMNKCGYDTYGYDVNKVFIKDLPRDRVVDDMAKIGQFDQIKISHVLEHVACPVKFLNGFKKNLKNDGQLIISVPNIDCPMNYYFNKDKNGWYHLPFHRQHFSKKSLSSFLNEAGYKVDYVITYSFGIGTISYFINKKEKKINLLFLILLKIKSLFLDFTGKGDGIVAYCSRIQ